MSSSIIFSTSKRDNPKVVFLDRDGVINKRPPLHKYVCDYDSFVFNDGIFELIYNAKKSGYMIIVITNQRGISKGLYTLDDFYDISVCMQNELKRNGTSVDAVYFCPHSIESRCDCRKPKPGMFLAAISDFGVDIRHSVMIGDSDDDILAARSAGILTTYKIESDTLSGITELFHT